MAGPDLSPRLASLVADHVEILNACQRAELLSTNDLGSFETDVGLAADRLNLSQEVRPAFASVFAVAKACARGEDEVRMSVLLDVLNGEGALIMNRPRHVVHRQGFWHRAVNVWVICEQSSRVLMGQRANRKEMDPGKWTCVCGRVGSGEQSYDAAAAQLNTELSINIDPNLPDSPLQLLFTLRSSRTITNGIFKEQQDNTWLDVYVARLKEEIPIEKLHLETSHKQAVKYVTLDELRTAYATRDEDYVIPVNEEYPKKLFHHLVRACA